MLLALAGGYELLNGMVAFFLYLWKGNPGGMASEAASIGIIGGADGPTAIFVTYSEPSFLQIWIPCLMIGAGIWGYMRLKRCQKKDK